MITITATCSINGDYGDIEIDKRNLISCNISIFDRGDMVFPSFGIISNGGEVEFIDIDGQVLKYSEALMLTKDLYMTFYLVNTITERRKEIGTYNTAVWDYDPDNKTVRVSLKDLLEDWQNINVESVSYDAKNSKTKTFRWFYEYLHDKTPTQYRMLSFSSLDDKTKSILENCEIQYPLLYSGSLWAQWTKLCEACQLHIYINNEGQTVCRYNGGN